MMMMVEVVDACDDFISETALRSIYLGSPFSCLILVEAGHLWMQV